jgi:tetratricopeptide (TPR) repeat protein
LEKFYCQKCLAANRFGQELCERCGTRLMLVVEPAAVRFDPVEPPALHEEHLLERFSALEYRLTRLTERMEQTLDLLLRQARNSYFDHGLIETLIGVLGEEGVIESDKLDEVWRERCRREAAEQDESQRRDELRAEIIAGYQGAESNAFKIFVEEGMKQLSAGNVLRGVRSLERAAAMAANNAPLHAFLGEHFYRAGKMALARDYLERALCHVPEDDRVCLLLGLACGDEGEAERAKHLLRNVVERGAACFAAHYALGRLLAAEERWADALVEFKEALAARPSAETHYVVGCVYYRLNRNRTAARHLRKAVEMNEGYSAALYMLGLVFLRSGDETRADEAFHAARAAGQDESRYRTPRKGRLQPDEIPALPPLFSAARHARKRLVTSGDKRLAEAMREDALRVGAQSSEANG